MPGSRLLLLSLALLATTATAQRRPRGPSPAAKTAAEALARFAKVRDQAEGERRSAVNDLGNFADAEVTDVLLAELERAADVFYQQAVVRALGERLRPAPAVVPALRQVLCAATNPRLMDSAAEGLARQGEAGVAALGEVLAQERAGGARRTSVCDGLAFATGDAARDLLVHETRTASGNDRLSPFAALRSRKDDAIVDELRLQLARDKDVRLAALAVGQLAEHRHADAPALALDLSRRLDDRATADQHAAVLRGLLLKVTAPHFEPILAAASRARDPFGKELLELWGAALGEEPFVRWLVQDGASRKLATERCLCAAVLALVPLPRRADVTPALARLLGSREPEVVRAAAQALAGFGPDLAQAPLQKLLISGADTVQSFAAQSLHDMRAEDAAWHGDLVGFAKGKSPTLRATALHLLAHCKDLDPGPALQAAGENLDHKSWQVRAAAIDLIQALRLPAGIPWLIERFDVEQARLQQDVASALHSLTKLRFPDGPMWRAWWQKEGPTHKVSPLGDGEKPKSGRAAPGTVVTYCDIPVRSDRVVFVVDVSGSMSQPFGTGGGTRLDEAKRQLVRVLGMLPSKAKTNVVTFGTGAVTFRDTLQDLDEKLRLSAEIFTKGLAARGATNVHAGLQRAFADPEVDTIFLLTDGAPSAGPIVAPDALAKEIAAWNLGRGLRIHTVALGGKSEFLERLARESGGEHTVAK